MSVFGQGRLEALFCTVCMKMRSIQLPVQNEIVYVIFIWWRVSAGFIPNNIYSALLCLSHATEMRMTCLLLLRCVVWLDLYFSGKIIKETVKWRSCIFICQEWKYKTETDFTDVLCSVKVCSTLIKCWPCAFHSPLNSVFQSWGVCILQRLRISLNAVHLMLNAMEVDLDNSVCQMHTILSVWCST